MINEFCIKQYLTIFLVQKAIVINYEIGIEQWKTIRAYLISENRVKKLF